MLWGAFFECDHAYQLAVSAELARFFPFLGFFVNILISAGTMDNTSSIMAIPLRCLLML